MKNFEKFIGEVALALDCNECPAKRAGYCEMVMFNDGCIEQFKSWALEETEVENEKF